MTEAKQLVSCIIPTKNRPEFVGHAVKSVIAQTYKNIEIIVVDDSTNDETQKVIAPLNGQIRYIKNERSSGAPYSRNVGLNEARGDVITFLDDDDIWFPKKIELQLEHLQRFPIVSCNFVTTVNGRKRYYRKPPIVGYENMLYYNYLGSSSFLMFDASVIKGCFFDEKIVVGQDWDFILSVMKKNNITEAGIVSAYLVEYSSGLHSRITTKISTVPTIFAIRDKYLDDYDDFTDKMFFLYNKFPANGDFLVHFFCEGIKAKLQNRNIGFLFIKMIKRLFGVIEIY